ncbi:MAG TPA: protein translocase subunit SecF [Vicinamibacterales bacterium]|nr:protein translocase subunit SecF [Vicinamibacterales bacterium]
MHIFHNTTFDFLKWRWHAIILSWVVIIAGIVIGMTKGVPLGLEFAGGTQVIAQFDKTPSIEMVRQAIDRGYPAGGENVIVQSYGDPAQRQVMIRVPQVGGEGGTALSATRNAVDKALRAGNLGNVSIVGTEIVSPTVGRDLSQKGLSAFVLSLIGILAYIAFRFEFSFAAGAVIATIHDIFVTFAFLAFFQYDLTLNVIAALLTVTGYSTNDTIVIFDRVRENLRSMRSKSLNDVVNLSLNQTLGRTVITAGTALLSAIALFLFGGEVLRGFAFTMIVGIVTGTYSSVFVAAAIVTFWNRKTRRIAAAAPSGDAAAGQRGRKQKRAKAS